MVEKEDNVYKAKLAEQAERYDGMMRGMRLCGNNSDRHVATRLCVILILVIRKAVSLNTANRHKSPQMSVSHR